MATKRQTTMTKIVREQRLKERRVLKQEKKQAAADLRSTGTPAGGFPAEPETGASVAG
jgi:hypothetical protein